MKWNIKFGWVDIGGNSNGVNCNYTIDTPTNSIDMDDINNRINKIIEGALGHNNFTTKDIKIEALLLDADCDKKKKKVKKVKYSFFKAIVEIIISCIVVIYWAFCFWLFWNSLELAPIAFAQSLAIIALIIIIKQAINIGGK